MTNGTSNPPSSTSIPKMPVSAGSVTAVTTGTLIMDTYEIEKLINSGGMGEVYRGRNIHNGEPVAIKIVLPALAHDPKIVALFQKESTVLSRLSHEAIVRYHTFTIDRSIGRPCMVMEFVSGLALGDRVDQGPMPLDEVKTMFRRIAGGLDKAHRAGVVHRDLSPDNVILEEDSVDHAKLIDFGIAKSASFGGGTLLGGQFAGKFNWVAPEQLGAFGGLVDGRSDIYSLALVVAAASRGKVVAMGDSIVDAVGKRNAVPDLTGVDPSLLPLLSYMLQPDPAKRPASMGAVIAALDNPALIPASVMGTEPAPPDPNRTVIGGALPMAQVSQVPVAGPTMPPVSLPPVSLPPILKPASMPPARQATAPPVTGDWAVPSARPVTANMATVITSQPPMTQAPVAEPEDISPFGAPAAVPSRPAVAAQAPVAAPKKGKGGLVAVLGLLVVVGGGAGAYFSGMIGGPAPAVENNGTEAEAAAAKAAAEAEAAAQKLIQDAKAAADQAAAQAQAAADAKAADAAEKLAAEKVAAEKAAADQAAADAAQAAEALANQTVEQQAAAAKAAEEAARVKAEADATAAAVAEAEAAANATAMAKAAEAEAAKAAEQEARVKAEADAAAKAEADAAAQAAADAAAKAEADAAAAAKAEADAAAKAAAESANDDPRIAQTAWLAGLSFDACTRLHPAPGDGLALDGFATEVAPLEALALGYKTSVGQEADILPHLINEEQCPVLDFVNRRSVPEVPALTVRRNEAGDGVKSGGQIAGVIEGINGRPYQAFLFSDAGGATNLKPFITVAPDGTASFNFTLSMAADAPPAPQLIMVMATEGPLNKLDAVPNGVSAKSLMPFIEVAMKDSQGPTALGLGFLRLEN